MTVKVLFEMSDELAKAVDAAKGDSARNPFLEAMLWKTAAIKNGAKSAGVVNPARPQDGRGTWLRGVSMNVPKKPLRRSKKNTKR